MGFSREIHRIRCYKIIIQTCVMYSTRMYNASRGRRRRHQWMVEVHPWWRLLRGIVPHLLGYELASSFDLPVISLRLLLPRLLRPSSCHLHRVRRQYLPVSLHPNPDLSPSSAVSRLLYLISSCFSSSLTFAPPSFCIEDPALHATRVFQIFVSLFFVLFNYLSIYWWCLR